MTTADDRSDSLISALSKARIPVGNHRFIERVTTAVGIADYQAMADVSKPYVRAVRRDGNRDLHIYPGFTAGFISEDDAARFANQGSVHPSSSRPGTWCIVHPENRVRPGGEKRAGNIGREAELCPTCYLQLPLTGICGECG